MMAPFVQSASITRWTTNASTTGLAEVGAAVKAGYRSWTLRALNPLASSAR